MAKPQSRAASADTLRSVARIEDLITEVAWLYYHDDLNQTEIADRLQVSRATVVNYLFEARLRGWVKLYLDSEVFLGHRISGELCKAYGLTAALVVPGGHGEGPDIDTRVLRAAADWFPSLLEPGDRMGVSWGETVFRLAQRVPRHTIEDLTVVQLLGSRPAALGFAAETCTMILAQQLGAHCINLHVPLLLSETALADRLRSEPVVADQLRSVAACNKTVLACGTCDDNAHIIRTGLLTAEEMGDLRRKGAVGVICGRLIDAQGQAVVSGIEDRMIGVTLDQMRGKEMALLVAAGSRRAGPARAAILGGYVTHLATSARIAEELLRTAP